MSSMCQEAKRVGSAQLLCTTATLLLMSQLAEQRSISCATGLQLRFMTASVSGVAGSDCMLPQTVDHHVSKHTCKRLWSMGGMGCPILCKAMSMHQSKTGREEKMV